jgi:hypothetical protein
VVLIAEKGRGYLFCEIVMEHGSSFYVNIEEKV